MTTPAPINRLGPSTPPQFQMPANANTFLNSPYNFQAQMLGVGNPGQGMYGFSQYLNTSPMMQRFLPEVTRHAMNQQNPFPLGGYQTPWSLNGLTATFNPAMLGQQSGNPSQPPSGPNLHELRQSYKSTLTPEQLALKGGDMGNKDFRQSLTPQQLALRQQVIDARNPQPAPMPGQPAGMPARPSSMPSQMQSAMSSYAPQGMPMNRMAQYQMAQRPQMPGGWGQLFSPQFYGSFGNPMMQRRFNLGMGW